MTVNVCMQGAMRRCGHNPTDIEVSDIINKIHNDTGSLDFEVGTETSKQGACIISRKKVELCFDFFTMFKK